jgi:hypothetical protein
MTLTAESWQNEIAVSLGQALQGGPQPDAVTQQMMAALASALPTYWAMNADRSTVRLQWLWTKRQCCLLLMGQLRNKTDSMIGRQLRLSYSQKFRNLKDIYTLIDKEITAEETRARARAGGGGLTAPILATAPVMANGYRHVPAAGEPTLPAPSGPGDPNWPGYGGFLPGYGNGAVPQPGD